MSANNIKRLPALVVHHCQHGVVRPARSPGGGHGTMAEETMSFATI